MSSRMIRKGILSQIQKVPAGNAINGGENKSRDKDLGSHGMDRGLL